MVETVLLAHDFSPSSERALAYAVDVAQRSGAALHLMHVDQTAEGVLFEGGQAPPSDELQERFEDRCRTSLAPHPLSPGDEQVACHAVRGVAPAPLLVEKAQALGADLLVTGTEGRRGARRLIVGSVAEEILRTAPCPVLTVREQDDADEGSPYVEVEKVIAPVDFSERTETALQYVSQLSSLYDAPVQLMHVVEDASLPSVYEAKSSKVQARAAEDRAEAELQSLGEPLVSQGVSVSTLVRRGETTDTVVQATGEPGTLTVMGTRGLSGVQRIMLGSVTEAVIRASSGPVLAARISPSDAD
jgi:nucleotide-binding universal stress UspA family protein